MRFIARLTIATTLAGLAHGSASAIDLQYTGVQSLGTYGTVTADGSHRHVYAGRMRFTVTSSDHAAFTSGSTIDTFCVDIRQSVTFASTGYELHSNALDATIGDRGIADLPVIHDPAAPGMGDVRAMAVSALYEQRFLEATGSDALKSSAFQLALWEIIFEPATAGGGIGTLNLSSGEGTFRVTSGDMTARSLAQTWLDEISMSEFTGVSDTLVGFASPAFQDQLTVVVPLPPAAWGGLLGLAAAGIARRRWRK
ncbi:MAG: hypothetical protein ACYTEV_07875 [Planctomycetota bacterium]|jgi:hypothetical protein